MKKIFTLFVLGVIASTSVFAAPISSGELFATYQKQGDTFYKGDQEADVAKESFEWDVNYYIVSCGDSVLLRATTTEDKNLVDGWPTQLRIWENAWNNGNEIQVDAGDNKNRYTSSCREIEPSASDLKIHFFLNWEGNCTTQTFAYNRSSINNPIEDAVAPSINPEEVTMEEVGDKLVFTFGAATADDEYFYYVGDKEHNLGGISLTNKVYITKPTIKDGITYSFKCYAVDYNGNKSDYKEFTLSMDFDPSIDLAFQKSCIAGYSNGGDTPDRAVNGETNHWGTYAIKDYTLNWWRVDLGAVYDLSKINITFKTKNTYRIEVSLDDINWHTILDNQPEVENAEHTGLTSSARYVRLTAIANKMVAMSSFQVYGTGIAVADATKPTVSVACTDKTITSATLQINAADTDDNGNAGIVTSIKVSDIANEFAEVEVISLLDGDNKITLDGLKDNTTYNFSIVVTDRAGNTTTETIEVVLPFNTNLNLALNKPCTGGYCQFGDHTPEGNALQYVKANDGNTTSSYSAYGAPSTEDAWWQVDLGMAYDVTQVKVFWANDYSNGFNIYGSLNGTDWVLIGTDAAKAAKDTTETAVTASTRYIKIHSYNKKNIVMYEVEVYGTGIAVADATKPTASVACTDKTITSATLQINAADTDDNGNAGIVTSIKVSDIANEFAEVEVLNQLDGDNKVTLSGLKDNTTYNFNIIVTDRAGNTTTETIEVVLPFNTEFDLAFQKSCIAGYSNGADTPDKAVNGETNHWGTWAIADYTLNWWRVDLGAVYDLSKINITFKTKNTYRIEVSLDDINWHTILDNQPEVENAEHTGLTSSARYVRLTAIANKMVAMSSFQVYGTGFSVADATKPTVSVACTDKTVTSATLQINAADTDDNGNAGIVTSIKVSDIANEFAEVEVISLLDGDNKITFDGLKDNTTYNFNIIVTDRAGNTTTETIEVVLPFNTNLNLALGGTATDGYHEGDGTAADKAIDGNADTKWNTYGVQNDDVEDGYIGDYANNWMSIDLGAAYDLSNIKLSFAWVWNNVITEYLIEGSLDGSNWYILAHITDQATDAADLIIDASAQYVRFRAITEDPLGIKEFEVYGTGFSTMTDALPIITFAQVGTITDNSAEIEISAADITTSPITQYIVTGADEAAIELTATDNKIVITGLAQSTTYAIQVQAKDNDGNLSAPQQLTFTTIGSVSGLYMYSGYFGWGEKTQERARFSNTAVEGVMVLTINNMTVGNHNFKLYNATDDRCTMGDCGGVSDHYIANQEVQTVTFYATSEDRFISSVDSLYLRGSLVGEDQALVWNEDHTVATWTGTLDLTGNKQFTIIKKCQVEETPHTYARDFYTEEQTFDGDYNYGTFTLDLTTMTGTWGYVGLSFEDYATSNNTIIAEHDGHKANVAINRTIKATGEWFTLCLPFDMDEDKVFEVFGNSTIATLVGSEDRGSLIHLNFDYVKDIKAGKAYMIKPGKDFVAGSIIEGVTIKNVNPENLKSTCDHMYFQGVFDQYLLEGDNKRFVSANNYLYSPADGGTTMGAFRCYFTIPVESQALVGSKAARIVFGPQVATGTENVQSDQLPSAKIMVDGTLYIIRDGRTYNAQGQLVK